MSTEHAEVTAPSGTTTLEELRAAAAATLTAAARFRYDRPEDQGKPWHGDRADFADLLAHVLAVVAANVGGTDQLLSGRPGSWEADLVRQLVNGTVGWDEQSQHLAGYRTESIRFDLYVANLLADTGAGDVDLRYDDAINAALDSLGPDADDVDCERAEAAAAALEAQRDKAYRTYGAALAEEIAREAAARGYTVPVEVQVLHAEYRLDNPGPAHGSLEERLLSAAVERVTPPAAPGGG